MRRPWCRRSLKRPPEPAAPLAEEFDHEIANIYSEEATELLEAAESSLTAWNQDRKDKEPVAELAASIAYPQGRRAHGGRQRHGRFES